MRLVLRVMAPSALIVMACATQVFAQPGFRNMLDHLHLDVSSNMSLVKSH